MASGFNVVDFMDLAPLERCIVRLILREVSMTYAQLCDAITTLPADQQMDQLKLDSVLDDLTRSNWVLREFDHEQLSYRVNTSKQARRQSGIDTLTPDQPRDEDLIGLKRGGKRTLPNHVWDCLTDTPEEPPAKPMRRASPFDKLMGDDSVSKQT